MRTTVSVVLAGRVDGGDRRVATLDANGARRLVERGARVDAQSVGRGVDAPATRTIPSVHAWLDLGDPLESQTIVQAKRTRSSRMARDRLGSLRTIASS